MSTATRPHLSHGLALAAFAVLGLLTAGTSVPAQAAPASPQLSIRVDDGQTEAQSESTLRYTVTVSNLGGKEVRDLVISQTVPTATKLGPVGAGGTAEKGAVRWRVDVPAGRSRTLETSVTVGKDLPPDLFRLATVACASTSAKVPPTVCASDSDQLPAGAEAMKQQRRTEEAAAVTHRPAWMLPAGLVLGGLLVIGALVSLLAADVLGRRDQPGRRGMVPHQPG